MITVTTIASGSTGNAYLIHDGKTILLLECGIPWAKIKKALGFNTSDISGVLCSHEHMDHSRAAIDVMNAGIDLYVSQGTAEARGLSGHRLNLITANMPFSIGTWSILPFDLQHDAAEPLGFLMASNGGDKLLFMTDTSYCKYRFNGITHLMIECNFDDAMLEQNLASGVVDRTRYYRLVNSHMSLHRVQDFILKNDISKLQAVWLMHLSDKNSDGEQFKIEIQRLTGVPVYVC